MFTLTGIDLIHCLLVRFDEVERKLCVLDSKLDALDGKLVAAQGILTNLLQEEKAMALDISDLTRAVEETKGVEESAVVLLTTILQKLKDAEGDPAAIAAVVAELDASTSALAAAVAAGNPPTA